MNATMLDFRTRMSDIQKAVSRDCATTGMWADRNDMDDPSEWVRTRRAKRKFTQSSTRGTRS